MIGLTPFICFFYVFATLAGTTEAMTEEQKKMIHQHFETIGAECMKTNVISSDDIRDLRARKVPSGENAPCFVACVLRNTGIMDEKGMLQKETALDLARKVFEDEEELKNIEDYLHSCSHVNEASVSDGEKGCERAILSFKCMTENASKFGFDL